MPLNRGSATALAIVIVSTTQARADDEQPVEVVVQGERTSHVGGHDPTAATYVVRREDLRAPGLTTAEALSTVPGVEVTRSGAAAEVSTASVRGATAAQTPVYLAGIRLNDDLTGTADLSLVPLWMLDRIEVYRGTPPFDADRLGIGGAVFLEPLRPKTTRVGAGGVLGSFGENGAWAAGSVALRDASVLLAVRREAAENDYPYLDDNGTRFVTSDDVTRTRRNADSTSYDGWGIGQLSLSSRAKLVMVSNVFTREQGVTGLAIVPSLTARLRTTRALGAISSTFPCSESGCIVELVTSGLASEQDLTDDAGRQFGLSSTRVDSKGQRVSQQERVHLDLGTRALLTFASEQEGERLDIDSEAPVLRARREFVRAASSIVVHATHALDVVALGAGSCDRVQGPSLGGACDFRASGRAGLNFAPTPAASLFANAGRYERAPTLGERFGLSPALRGNPSLVPETGWSLDAGARWSGRSGIVSRAYVEGFAFARFASELIAFRRSSFNAATPYNVGTARVLGAEVSAGMTLDLNPVGAIRFEVASTALDPRDTTAGRTLTNDILPFRARLVVSPLLEFFTEPASRPLGLDRVSWSTRTFYRSSSFADPAGLTVFPEQFVVDTDVALSFFHRALDLRLRLSDVFDARTFDVIGYPLPGRSLHASVEVWW